MKNIVDEWKVPFPPLNLHQFPFPSAPALLHQKQNLSIYYMLRVGNLARNSRRNVFTRSACLSTRDLDAGPGPAAAGARAAQDVDVCAGGRDGAGDAGEREVGDGHAGGGIAAWGAILVVLFDDNTFAIVNMLDFEWHKRRLEEWDRVGGDMDVPYLVMPERVISL